MLGVLLLAGFEWRGMLMADGAGVKTDRRHCACSKARASPCRAPGAIVSRLRQVASVLFFAARSEAVVDPPPTLTRFSDSRMPWVGTGARFALSVRELTPIHAISEDRRPYSIFGQRFITTLSPAAS